MSRRSKFLATVSVLVILLFTFSTVGWAIEWVTANQSTIQWQEINTDIDGDPLPAGTHVEYKILLANLNTDPNKTNPATLDQVTGLEYTITLNTKGSYAAGVQALHLDDSTGEVLAQSATAWGDNPDDAVDTDGDGVGNDFGIRFFAALPSTKLQPKPVP